MTANSAFYRFALLPPGPGELVPRASPIESILIFEFALRWDTPLTLLFFYLNLLAFKIVPETGIPVLFRPNANGRIATVQLRWEDPDTHQVTEIAPKPDLRALASATSIPGI